MVGVGKNRGKPLVPPDRCFDYFVTADKVMPLQRAERKVRLRDFLCVKNIGIEKSKRVEKGKYVTPSVSFADSSLRDGA